MVLFLLALDPLQSFPLNACAPLRCRDGAGKESNPKCTETEMQVAVCVGNVQTPNPCRHFWETDGMTLCTLNCGGCF